MLDQTRYSDSSKQSKFVRSLVPQLRQRRMPGVEQVAVSSSLPSSGSSNVSFRIKGQQETRSNEQYTSGDSVVTTDFFEVAGVPVLSGRTFTDHDDVTAPRIVVVNQEFAHRYFQDHDPIGKQIQLDIPGTPLVWSEIVGVVGNVRNYSEDPNMLPQVYEAYLQRPVASFALMLRSNMEPDSLTPALRHAVEQLDAELPLLRVRSMDGVIDDQRNGNPLFEQVACDLCNARACSCGHRNLRPHFLLGEPEKPGDRYPPRSWRERVGHSSHDSLRRHEGCGDRLGDWLCNGSAPAKALRVDFRGLDAFRRVSNLSNRSGRDAQRYLFCDAGPGAACDARQPHYRAPKRQPSRNGTRRLRLTMPSFLSRETRYDISLIERVGHSRSLAFSTQANGGLEWATHIYLIDG